MPKRVALLFVLSVASSACAGFMPATPATIEIPIPPVTTPLPSSGAATFLNAAGEELLLSVESRRRGTDANGLTFAFNFASTGAGAPPVQVLGDHRLGYTFLLDAENPPRLWELSDAIDALPGLAASVQSDATDLRIASLPLENLVLAGGIGRGGIAQDVLLEVTGPRLWIEWLRFVQGTTADELAGQFNLLTDATRVEARIVDDRLVLSTLDVGSRAYLWLHAVIEAGGRNEPRTFTDALGPGMVFAQGRDAVIPEPATIVSFLVAVLAGVSTSRLRS